MTKEVPNFSSFTRDVETKFPVKIGGTYYLLVPDDYDSEYGYDVILPRWAVIEATLKGVFFHEDSTDFTFQLKLKCHMGGNDVLFLEGHKGELLSMETQSPVKAGHVFPQWDLVATLFETKIQADAEAVRRNLELAIKGKGRV